MEGKLTQSVLMGEGQPSRGFNYSAGKSCKVEPTYSTEGDCGAQTVESHDVTPNVHKNTQRAHLKIQTLTDRQTDVVVCPIGFTVICEILKAQYVRSSST